MTEHETQRKVLRAKSNPSDGNMCRNCHMRLGHTSRSCEYDKCLSVFSCGEEKLHPGEINSRSVRTSIQKLKGVIEKLEKDFHFKENASNKICESLGNKIETTLLQENGNRYIEAGIKKWALLRKHVFIIEKYCKQHFGGSIPPKHRLSDILNVALEKCTPDDGDKTDQKFLSRVKTKRANPARDVLEARGISFPDIINVNESSTSQSNLMHRCAPCNKDEEEEQLTMVLNQSLLESKSTAPQVATTDFRQSTPFNTFHHGHGFYHPSLNFPHAAAPCPLYHYSHATGFQPPPVEMYVRDPGVSTYGSFESFFPQTVQESSSASLSSSATASA